ncbi:hypothetical protein U1Q18_018667 [Sarracenia purpurea var. burkii]
MVGLGFQTMGTSENVNGRIIAVATSPSESVAAQDSSIFGYISNLSPVKPGNAAPEIPGFPGLSSPPIVFKSPHINPLEGKTYLERSQGPQSSCAEELCQQNDRGKKIEISPVDFEISDNPSGSNFIPCIAKECDNKGSDSMEVPCKNYAHSASLSLIQTDDMPPLNDYNNFMGTILKFDNKNDTSQDAVKATSTCPATLEIPDRNMVLYDPKFEEAEQNITENSADLWSSSDVVISSRLPVSPADLEVYESCLENCGNSRSTVSKQSGVGLYLNSIVNSMPMGCGLSESMKSAKKGYLNIQERKFISTNGCHEPENTKNCSILLNARERFSACSEGGIHKTQASITSSLASQSPQIVISSTDPALLKQNDQTTPCGKRKSISEEHAQAVEELNRSNPKKKRQACLFFRRKVSATNDDDGCKRCNCKKTKCLKLYCDCFAAGIYCDGPCSCQECFNRPEYEDTVLETRQLIESRNPLAFAPRIVKQLTGALPNSNEEDSSNSTPSSTRHKRGCNCKKSMCSKKYCECYQVVFLNGLLAYDHPHDFCFRTHCFFCWSQKANVGCSSGCRCEGCKNIYGKKEGNYLAQT